MKKHIIKLIIFFSTLLFVGSSFSQKLPLDATVDRNDTFSLAQYIGTVEAIFDSNRSLFNANTLNYYQSWKVIYQNSVRKNSGFRDQYEKLDNQFYTSQKKRPQQMWAGDLEVYLRNLKSLESGLIQKPGYEGQSINGVPNGKGKMFYEDGNTYVGEFKNGQIYGQGTYIWRSGGKYTGGWVNGNFDGQGERIWQNGDRYIGGFKNGKRTGTGTITFAKGTNVYTGQFLDDLFSGDGTMTWAQGATLYTNEGDMIINGGAKYVGKWQKDVGVSGTLTFASGDYMSGTISNDVVFTPTSVLYKSQSSKPQANNQPQSRPSTPQANNQSPSSVQRQIKSLKYDNSIYKGETVNDEPDGIGQITYFNGNKFEGNFVNGKREGRGIFTWKDGDVYSGYYKNNEVQGFGRYEHVTGELYIGEFKNGKMEGRGTFISKDGTKTVGTFKDNQYVGP